MVEYGEPTTSRNFIQISALSYIPYELMSLFGKPSSIFEGYAYDYLVPHCAIYVCAVLFGTLYFQWLIIVHSCME